MPTGDIEAYILQLWGPEATQARSIFFCESGLKPSAINPERYAKAHGVTTYSSYGVAQLNRPYDPKLLDYRYNLEQAHDLWLKRSWQPWSCWKGR